LELSQINYFCAVCDCGSISGAAKRLYVAQPSVSIAIKKLETELNVALFTRYNNHLTLTAEGKRFLEKACQLLQLVDDMKTQVKEQPQRLRVLLTPLLGLHLITPLIRLFDQMKMRYPQCEFEVSECDTSGIPARLLSREADLALALDNLDWEPQPGLSKMVLYRVPLKAYMNRDHPLAQEQSLSVEQLREVSLIIRLEHSAVRNAIEDWFCAHGCTPCFQMRFSQFNTVRIILENGNRENVILSPIRFNDSPNIVERPLSEEVCVEAVALWRREQALNSTTIHFLEKVKSLHLF